MCYSFFLYQCYGSKQKTLKKKKKMIFKITKYALMFANIYIKPKCFIWIIPKMNLNLNISNGIYAYTFVCTIRLKPY